MNTNMDMKIKTKREFNVHKIIRCMRWLRTLIQVKDELYEVQLKIDTGDFPRPEDKRALIDCFTTKHFLPSWSLGSFKRLAGRFHSPDGRFILLSHRVGTGLYYITERGDHPLEIHVSNDQGQWTCTTHGGLISSTMCNYIIEDVKQREHLAETRWRKADAKR